MSQSASEFVSCVFWSEEIETDDEMKSSSEKLYMYDTYYVETAVYKNPHGMHNTLHTCTYFGTLGKRNGGWKKIGAYV